MEEFLKSKQFKILGCIFILISILHVAYATITMRGMYEDGGDYMFNILNNIPHKNYVVVTDYDHTRFCIAALIDYPIYLLNIIFPIHNKFFLMMFFTFNMLGFPLLALWWNYNLTKRTQRLDIFYWSLFTYSLILITFSIFSVVEIIIGGILNFILFNYLAGNINYKKRDIFCIIFLLIIMFGTYEYNIFLGPIFFLASFIYAKKEPDKRNRIIKRLIGIGALFASIFDIIYMINIPGESNEIIRFIKEGYDFLPNALNLNISFSFIALVLLFLFIFKKKKAGIISLILCSILFILNIYRLSGILQDSIYPMWEQHMRTIPCYTIPLIFLIIYLFDLFKKPLNYTKLTNYICIVLLCGIAQSCWQMAGTYFWDKNIQYMKSELNKTNDLLYIPSEHEEISGFHNPQLRRFIWHGLLTKSSILFSDTYEQKTLLMSYDKQMDNGNYNYREELYYAEGEDNKISLPYGGLYDIKNRFWDLTKCAEALRQYDIEHHIHDNKESDIIEE